MSFKWYEFYFYCSLFINQACKYKIYNTYIERYFEGCPTNLKPKTKLSTILLEEPKAREQKKKLIKNLRRRSHRKGYREMEVV